MNNKQMTTKIFPSFTKSMDAETGIVEAYVSIMGIRDLDSPPDVIQMGAFVKSIQERGPQGARKIRVLRQHWRDEVIGLPLVLVEHPRDMLPPALLEQYPEATGGLFARTQFVMDTQMGRETYALYKAGAMDEWSIGFDTLQFEYLKDEEEDTFRVLKELKMWEYSPVTWGMNPGTITTDVKREGGPNSREFGTALMHPDGAQLDPATVTTDVKEQNQSQTAPGFEADSVKPQNALTEERARVKILEIGLSLADLRNAEDKK